MQLGTLCFAASQWPDSIDRIGMLTFLTAVLLLPIVGYWLTVLDVRAYLRALRGVLVRMSTGRSDMPSWMRDETPPCIRALGLSLPCSEDDIKQAYRRMAKELHPDRGGDVQHFLLLQDHVEQARYFLKQCAE